MKKISYILVSVVGALALPAVSFAQFDPTNNNFGTLLANIVVFSNTVLIPFVIAIGFLVFVWGMFQFFIAGGSNDEAKEKGKSLMIYATLGFVLIIVFWGIINLIASSTGMDASTVANVPVAPTI